MLELDVAIFIVMEMVYFPVTTRSINYASCAVFHITLTLYLELAFHVCQGSKLSH